MWFITRGGLRAYNKACIRYFVYVALLCDIASESLERLITRSTPIKVNDGVLWEMEIECGWHKRPAMALVGRFTQRFPSCSERGLHKESNEIYMYRVRKQLYPSHTKPLGQQAQQTSTANNTLNTCFFSLFWGKSIEHLWFHKSMCTLQCVNQSNPCIIPFHLSMCCYLRPFTVVRASLTFMC